MSEITAHAQGQANQYALLKGAVMIGELLGNGELLEDQHLQLAIYAINLLSGRLPIAPKNAKWKALTLDDPKRLTLVGDTSWLLVLTTYEVIPAINFVGHQDK